MVGRSFTVHTCTWSPSRCARRMKDGVATGTGTWTHRTPVPARRSASGPGGRPAVPPGRRAAAAIGPAAAGRWAERWVLGPRGTGGAPSRTSAVPSGEAAMHTGRSSARRAARSRLAEKETTHTRSHALVRRSTPASGATAGVSLRSMLNRTSGQAASTSSRTGIGSAPATRTPARSLMVSRQTRPGWPVTRSSVRSWKATSTPSAVACASVSMYS